MVSLDEMQAKYRFAISRRETPEGCMIRYPLKTEGAGNAGRPMRPQPRV